MTQNKKSYALPVARTVTDLREIVSGWRKAGLRVGLVPTMGALHAGHISLVDLARQQADRVVVSIFVNPTQFAPNEDFSAYPRIESADAEKLAGHADLIFAPSADEMYPQGFSTTVTVAGVSAPLEGSFRPTHFAGVATVVSKLLLQTLPDVAVFGEKDYQQLMVIRRMVADLNIPVAIVPGPTLRESDGLALSSRNAYLSPEQRAVAAKLNVILRESASSVAQGEDVATVTAEGERRIIEAGFDSVDYLAICDASSLTPFTSGKAGAPARILVAARIGRTRLIDNMPV
ncbi:MAG: pantoate--beta-alanine ligase [Parvibaculaceae bacterium]|nr:pantoate--beta-alanine ligase [Parvibaculaceae bacterium]